MTESKPSSLSLTLGHTVSIWLTGLGIFLLAEIFAIVIILNLDIWGLYNTLVHAMMILATSYFFHFVNRRVLLSKKMLESLKTSGLQILTIITGSVLLTYFLDIVNNTSIHFETIKYCIFALLTTILSGIYYMSIFLRSIEQPQKNIFSLNAAKSTAIFIVSGAILAIICTGIVIVLVIGSSHGSLVQQTIRLLNNLFGDSMAIILTGIFLPIPLAWISTASTKRLMP